ncbi:MAG: hypothetical protein ACHRXM_38180 [Isosphaerales bacterium]
MPFFASDFGDEDTGASSFSFSAEVPSSVAGPMAMDRFIKQMIYVCWILLPKERKSLESLEKEIRRLVDRAFKDLKDDCESLNIKD